MAIEPVHMRTGCLQQIFGIRGGIKKSGRLRERYIAIFNTVDDDRGCGEIFKLGAVGKMKLQQPLGRQEPLLSSGDLI